MRTSEHGILELCEHEGIVPAPYLDSVDVWTFGVGHTAAAGGPDPAQMNKAFPATEDEINKGIEYAVKQFAVDLRSYEDAVNQAIRVPLKQHEFDALVSFHYNTGGIHRARLTKAINARDPRASEHFMGWLRPPEIRGRRVAEKQLFETGDYAANGNSILVWGTDGAGKLTRPIRTVSGEWVLSVMGRQAPAPKPVKVPDEVAQVVEDACKTPATSTTNWSALVAILGSAWTAFKSADPTVQVAAFVAIAVLAYIMRERIRKANLGKIAKQLLG